MFLNRRGYAPLTLCRACGHRFQCPNCSAWLVEHRFRHAAHLSSLRPFQERRPGSSARSARPMGALIPCGPGESSDWHGGGRRPLSRRRAPWCCHPISSAVRTDCVASSLPSPDGRCDIVIGTQLVAKGHNFPLLTLGGGHRRRHRPVDQVIRGLAERTFQLMQQVTGRARPLRTSRARRPANLAARPPGDSRARLRRMPSASTPRKRASARSAGLPPFRAARRRSSCLGADFSATQAHARALWPRRRFRLPPSRALVARVPLAAFPSWPISHRLARSC